MPAPTSLLLSLWLEQTLDQIVLLLDNDGLVTAALGSVERTFGYAPAELLGQPASLLFVPEDRALQLDVHELATAARLGRMEDDRWMLRKDGARIWVTGSVTPLVGAGGERLGFAKALRERTELRAEMETLRNRAAAGQAIEERNVVLLGALAHELRNPLAPLVTATELLRRLCDDERARLPLQIIDRQIAVLRRVVEDLMDTTRIETGKLELRPEPIELQGALRRVVEPRQDAARAGQIELVLSLPAPPITIEADATRFEQIFANLLNNALKYTPPGGRVSVSATVVGPEAVILVEDSGIGIAPDVLPRIFEMFAQDPGARSLAGGGLGIGLALVKRLVEAHGGSVQVQSGGRDRGSEFSVRLPLRQRREP
jgi:two-component system CheB/CheR fusion protein